MQEAGITGVLHVVRLGDLSLVLILDLCAGNIWLNWSFPLKKNAFFVWLLKYIFSWFTADITGYFSLHCFILFLPSKCCISRACIGMFFVLLFPVPMAFNVISVLMPVKFMVPAPGSTFVYPTSILSLSSILFLGVQSQLHIYKRQFLIFNPKPMCPIQVFPS